MRSTLRTGIWSTLLTAACGTAALTLFAQAPRQVDDATLLKPPAEEWVTYGRDYAGNASQSAHEHRSIEHQPPRPRLVGRGRVARQD